MLKTTRKITLAVILTMVLTTVVIFAAILYPNAKFVFSGMTMQNGENGKVQGFVNLRLENVNATGVNFKLVYDENYIVPSDYKTNNAIETDDFSTVYVQNTDNFPADSLSANLNMNDGTLYMSISPNTKNLDQTADNGGIKFSPDYEGVSNSYFYIAADDYAGGLDLGVLSFQIVDPAAVSQMTEAELNKIFYVVTDSMNIMYYDTQNEFCEETIDYEWNVDVTLIDVWPVSDEITVLAPDIFNIGKAQDLIDYLNLNYNHVQLRWSNDNVTLDNITWDSQCKISGTYSPKGGTYTVTQAYNDDFEITVTVHVEKVNLLSFVYENQSKTYTADLRPDEFADLELPVKATPVLDKIVTKYALTDVDIDGPWDPDTLPDDFIARVEKTYEFKNTVSLSELEKVAPWLTTDTANVNITAYRTIGEKTTAPIGITAEVEKLDGKLTIYVSMPDDTPADENKNTKFKVKFPNGYILDSSNPIMTENVTDSVATIVIDTDNLTDAVQNMIQSMINLGGSGFELSATEDGKGESDYVGFISPKRENFYTQNEKIDYSGANAVFFRVYAGDALDDITKHISFADSSVISIAYDGITGQEPGAMREVHVDEWTIKDDPSIHLPAAGTTVTLVGTMTDGYFYTNHGTVTNEDGYVLELVVTTVAKPELLEEKIKVTANETEVYEQFIYNTKKLGYTDAQVQTFTIHNIGNQDIEGLNVQISSTDFVLVSAPDTLLEKEPGETTFRISTKTGMGLGTHTATVTIGSNANATLKSFVIKFTVTDQEVYKVDVIVTGPEFGDAIVVGSAYYVQGDNVELLATPNTGCDFMGWTSTDVPEIDGSVSQSEFFDMPGNNVTIYAAFEENIEGKLRIEDLKVKNPDNSDNDLRDTVTKDVISFSRDVYDYYVIVPYETEQNKLWIKPRNAEIEEVTIVPVIDNGGTDILCTLDDDGYYKTELFGLAVGENEYIITQTYGETYKTYTVIIERRKQVGVTRATGNSPFGLIEADSTLTDTQKKAEKEHFSKYHCYNTVPENAGDTGTQKYYTDAWVDKNYDEDPYALFVYSGKAFVDPGFSNLVDSAGNAVDAADVKRTITIAELQDTADTNVVSKLTNTKEAVDVIISGGESCVINTVKNYDVRPGIYKIVYSFTDSDGFENSFSRPLIVLYDKGDADVTGAVDSTDDYNNIYNRMGNGISSDIINNSADWCAVYAYRICDVNSDRNVNSIDANNIKSNTGITKFYKELPETM